jgi:hypothetical protein
LDEGISPEGVSLEAEYFMVTNHNAIVVHSGITYDNDDSTLQVQGALEAIAKHMDETQQLVAMVVDARPGKLVSIRMGPSSALHDVLPEVPISFNLKREAIVSLTLESAASENVHFVVEDAGEPSAGFIVHKDQGRAALRAVAWLEVGPHALSVRCRPIQVGQPGFVHGPARLEVWRYPTGLATWRKALDICDPGTGAELLECAAARGGCGAPHNQDAAALADAIRAIAASAYA